MGGSPWLHGVCVVSRNPPEGDKKALKKVELAKMLLKEYGIEPERLEMFNLVFIEGDQFAEAARMMTKKVEELGSLKLVDYS